MLALLQHALRLAPTAAKALAALVFLLNVGSWPLVWHFRVFSSVIEAHVAFRLTWLRHLLSSKETRAAALEAWHEARMPIGAHPFRKVWTYASWVSVDDSDFNLHMSNSSYAKALDSARFRLALATFPNIFRCGGWVPLAATHYHFIREIPMLSRYEVRASIGAWDDKWIWVISRFVKPASRSTRPTPAADPKPPANPLVATLKTPATPLLETPASGGSPPAAMEPEEVSKALLARGARELEADGSLLYTVCVSQLCFKVGRLTVPPAVVLAANGFYASPAPSSSAPTSAPASTAAPPPYWPATRRTRTAMPLLKAFYAGGWRAERWWEGAFAACEGERRARLRPFVGAVDADGPGEGGSGRGEGGRGGIKGGLEGVRGLA